MEKPFVKTVMARLIGAAAIGGVVAMGAAGLVGQEAVAGISTTKHNLGTGGTNTNHLSTGTTEICVFCHTPHGADASAAVPLWNRKLTGTTYTTYNSLGTSSLDGGTAAVGSVSIACLSCHDGAQAMNVMINQPGSGGYNAAGAANSTDVWAGSGTLNGDTITNIGANLKNDHPVGIQYAGGPSGTIPAAGSDYSAFNDADFKTAKSKAINGSTVWWVETGTDGRQKTDMQLYTRTDQVALKPDGTNSATTMSGAQPYVECASCHDPHTDTNATFLRVSNAASAVCLACHTK